MSRFRCNNKYSQVVRDIKKFKAYLQVDRCGCLRSEYRFTILQELVDTGNRAGQGGGLRVKEQGRAM